jgi:hypothetical protein
MEVPAYFFFFSSFTFHHQLIDHRRIIRAHTASHSQAQNSSINIVSSQVLSTIARLIDYRLTTKFCGSKCSSRKPLRALGSVIYSLCIRYAYPTFGQSVANLNLAKGLQALTSDNQMVSPIE